ncbi:unnamed protein product [Closterium sp. Naga37s-1]|nr:unnamed protein product [Closterium sp. Naga37s-1]
MEVTGGSIGGLGGGPVGGFVGGFVGGSADARAGGTAVGGRADSRAGGTAGGFVGGLADARAAGPSASSLASSLAGRNRRDYDLSSCRTVLDIMERRIPTRHHPYNPPPSPGCPHVYTTTPTRRLPPQLVPHSAACHGVMVAGQGASQCSCRTVLDIMERRIPFVPRGGLSFVDVRDVASAFIAAMQSAAPNTTYLLGAVNMTLSNYFHLIARCADVAPPWLSVPPRVAWVLAATASKLLPLIGQKDPSLDPVVVEMAQVYW